MVVSRDGEAGDCAAFFQPVGQPPPCCGEERRRAEALRGFSGAELSHEERQVQSSSTSGLCSKFAWDEMLFNIRFV